VIEFLALPFIACLVLTAIHVYLGLHVLARGVIFADLALAQTAALGITVAFLAGHAIQSDAAYWYALVFTLAGAGLFAGSRTRRARVPQEALIGIVYAVSAAAAVLVVDRAPQGSEHIKQLLVGSILTVTGDEVRALTLLYAVLGALLWAVRRPLLLISFDPDGAAQRHAVRAWDFVFYASFGLVVTSSVRVAGVLLVFSYLVVPATVAALLTDSVRGRLLVGWAVGVGVSAGGLFASYAWDLPTGATVVVTFGAALAGVALALAARGLGRAVRTRGTAPLRSLGVGASALVGLAGLLLALFPRMDHVWLDWIEAPLPAVELGFLTPRERETSRESRDAIARATTELARLRALQQEVRWGARAMHEEATERLRQFVAGQSELAAGDRMVLRTLRTRARERQRYWIGVPLLVAGTAGALALARGRCG